MTTEQDTGMGRRDPREIVQGAPSGYFVVLPQVQDEEAIDLATLRSVVLRSWKLVIACCLLAAAIAAGISLLITPMYRAQTMIAPVTQNGPGAGGLLNNQLGGLAALAGIDLGSSGGRKEESLATLGSSGFAREFIVSQNLMPILFADQWDAQAGTWRTGKKPPSLEDGVTLFTSEVTSITEDRKSGLATVVVEWRSGELAARWANLIVEKVNERLRAEATRNSERSIEYLNKELAKTNVVEIRQAIYRLIEEQVHNAMLANVQREYAFRVIDQAVAPEHRVRPKRTVMVLVGAIMGLFLGVAIALLRHRLSGPADVMRG